MYNQIIARTETRGTDARIPPMKELFLDASEIATINTAERATLIMYCHIVNLSLINKLIVCYKLITQLTHIQRSIPKAFGID